MSVSFQDSNQEPLNDVLSFELKTKTNSLKIKS